MDEKYDNDKIKDQDVGDGKPSNLRKSNLGH